MEAIIIHTSEHLATRIKESVDAMDSEMYCDIHRSATGLHYTAVVKYHSAEDLFWLGRKSMLLEPSYE